MKILYVTNARLPTEKAHGLATVKLCEAFAKLGHNVTIIHPCRKNPIRQDVYAYYGIGRDFRIVTLPCVDFLWLGFGERLFFLVQLFSFSKIAALWLLFRHGFTGGLRDAVVFSHDHVPLFFASFFAPHIVYDTHRYPTHSHLYKRVLRKARLISVQTRSKVEKLHREFGIPIERIVYWPNGTDVERFDLPLTIREARTKLSLVQERKIVLYSGSLISWKGVDTLVAAAGHLPPHIGVYVLGGSLQEIEEMKTRSPKSETRNLVFVGRRPLEEIPFWLKAADVLVIPNTARDEESRLYTSPMKLFEYMASGRPIVASDIPSIREIVDETTAFFAEPDNPRSFADAIQNVLADHDEAERRARCAREAVRQYTWEARAEKILAKIVGW